MPVKALYSDLDESNISATLLYDLADIYQSLDNLLNTIPGERLFLPEYGTDLEQYLFDPLNDATAFAILGEVVNAVTRWEPRVKVNFGQSSVTPNPEQKRYDLVVYFDIVGITNQQFNYQAGISK